MSRSLKKGPYIDERLAKKISTRPAGDRTPIKTWARSAVITPEMIGVYFSVHTGKSFATFLVTEDMVGFRLGEFAPTRTFRRHGGKMAKEQEAAAQAGNTPKPTEGAKTGSNK